MPSPAASHEAGTSGRTHLRPGRFTRLAHAVARTKRLSALGLAMAQARRRGAGEAGSRAIAARMAELRGLPQKIGQILSLGDFDADSGAFDALTESAQAVPASDSFAWIEAELGRPIGALFSEVDARGVAASLAQVHRGVLHDGRTVAIKVQYPNLASGLDVDLAALGWLSAPLSAHRRGYGLTAYRQEMRRALLEELDYTRETEALRRFASRAATMPGLRSPLPVDGLCTDRLITMTWIDGVPFRGTRTWPVADRTAAALTLVRLFLRGVFEWGELHADPHPGNLRFHQAPGGVHVGLIDLGCVYRVPDAVRDVFGALATNPPDTSDSLLELYTSAGFDADLLAPMAGRLSAVTGILFEPFHQQGPYDVRTWRLGERLAEALGDDRWTFRFAGPASLIYFLRSLAGLVQYVRGLDAVLDWRQELLDAASSRVRDPRAVHRAAAPSAPSGSTLMPQLRATTLRLSVVRGGRPVVALSFGAAVVERLHELVPVELAESIARRGIDIASIGAAAAVSGGQPGPVFDFEDGETTVKVWLE